MDNKLTKSRLSNLIAYDWIAMMITIVIAIVVLEIVFNASAARLTVGQQFNYYYDETIFSGNDKAFNEFIVEKKTFSYDVINVAGEGLTDEYNTLPLRISVHAADILITEVTESVNNNQVFRRSDAHIDSHSISSIEKLVNNARAYVTPFITDASNLSAPTLNEQAIEENFNKRMARDNRYRFNDEARAEGFKLEKERIIKLCKDIADLEYLLERDKSLPENQKLFYSYKRYTQMYNASVDNPTEKQRYEQLLANEKVERYGLRVDRLITNKNKKNPSDFFRKVSLGSAQDVVILAFDFTKQQPDLQYETLSFITMVVREFGTELDNR